MGWALIKILARLRKGRALPEESPRWSHTVTGTQLLHRHPSLNLHRHLNPNPNRRLSQTPRSQQALEQPALPEESPRWSRTVTGTQLLPPSSLACMKNYT